MEKNQFNIDRLLRSKLSRPVAGPDDDARKLMEEMLRNAAGEKRRKKRGFWWFFTLIGLCGLCWGIWSLKISEAIEVPSQEINGTASLQPDTDTIQQGHSKNVNSLTSGSGDQMSSDLNTNNNSDQISLIPPVIDTKTNDPSRKAMPELSSNKDLNKQIPASHHTSNAQRQEDIAIEKTSADGKAYHEIRSTTDHSGSEKETGNGEAISTLQHSDNKETTAFIDSGKVSTIQAPPLDSLINSTQADTTKPATEVTVPADPVPAQLAAPKIKSWEATAGLAWSKFNLQSGIAFAANDRETMTSVSGWSPDFALRRNVNRFQIGLGYSSFKWNQSISDDSIRVADGEYIIVEQEITTDEYYDTELDEKLRQFSAISNFTSKNIGLQGGFNLLKSSRFQITPHLGLEFQQSKYEELSYHRIGFYSFIDGSDPLVDYYDIWHEKKRSVYSNWMINGLGSVEFNAVIWRNVFLSFEPVVHYPLKSNKSDYQKTLRLDAKFSIGFRLMK